MNKLRTCVDYDSCNCKHLFGPEKTTWSVSSKATKQLAITRCPKVSTIEIHLLKLTWNIMSKNGMTPIDVLFQILCIHLLRASISFDGELVKRQVSTKKDT